jgi:hypothetical protein
MQRYRKCFKYWGRDAGGQTLEHNTLLRVKVVKLSPCLSTML